MAARRVILPALRCAVRTLTKTQQRCVRRQQLFHCRERILLATELSSVASQTPSSGSQIEDVLRNGSLKDIAEMRDQSRDVYILGVPFNAEENEIRKFFDGCNIEDVCILDDLSTRIKRICYVRFADEGSKQEALNKKDKHLGNRYIEILETDKQNFLQMARFVLCQRSNWLICSNIPFGKNSADIIKWFQPLKVKDIVFVSRGDCIVELGPNEVDAGLKKHMDKMDQRPIKIHRYAETEEWNKFTDML